MSNIFRNRQYYVECLTYEKSIIIGFSSNFFDFFQIFDESQILPDLPESALTKSQSDFSDLSAVNFSKLNTLFNRSPWISTFKKIQAHHMKVDETCYTPPGAFQVYMHEFWCNFTLKLSTKFFANLCGQKCVSLVLKQ